MAGPVEEIGDQTARDQHQGADQTVPGKLEVRRHQREDGTDHKAQNAGIGHLLISIEQKADALGAEEKPQHRADGKGEKQREVEIGQDVYKRQGPRCARGLAVCPYVCVTREGCG